MKKRVVNVLLTLLVLLTPAVAIIDGFRPEQSRTDVATALILITVSVFAGLVLMARHMSPVPEQRQRVRRRRPVPFHVKYARLQDEIAEVWEETRFRILPWR